MKTMVFTRQLMGLVRQGKKTQTRRLIYYSSKGNPVSRYAAGDICLLKVNRFEAQDYGKVLIKGIRKEVLNQITEADAMKEGFPTKTAFLKTWDRINGEHTRDNEVWVIDFEGVNP